MSYLITKTDGTILATTNMPNGTLLDGTTDSSIGLTLVGRNYPNYGQIQNDNFVHLVENFADTVPPTSSLAALSALVGTIWYDTGLKKIRVFDGTNWNPASSTFVANLAPTTSTYTLSNGDQWWDTVNLQLNSWNGTNWVLIGPDRNAFSMLEAELESNVAAINANVTQLRVDTGNYMTANVATINANVTQLRIDTGNYMTANVVAVNSSLNQLRVDTGNYMTANVATINANIGTVQTQINSTIASLAANTSAGFVAANANAATIATSVNSLNQTLSSALNQLRVDTGNYMTSNVATLNSTISTVQTQINSTIASLAGNTSAGFTAANANAATITTSVNSINQALTLLAPLANPVFTGTPHAPTASPGNNSAQLATTAYVDASALVLSTDYNTKIGTEASNRNIAIANAINPLAPLASPALT